MYMERAGDYFQNCHIILAKDAAALMIQKEILHVCSAHAEALFCKDMYSHTT